MKVLLIGLLLSFPAYAKTTLEIDHHDRPKPTEKTYYEISGTNPTPNPQIIITRISDKKNAPYHDRVNEERWVLPGPFKILVQPSALQTPSGRFLSLSSLRETHVFSPAKVDFKSIIRRETEPISPHAFDFGPDNSPVFSGFNPIAPTSPKITGGPAKGFIRKGVDSLIRDGIKGITKFETPLPNGHWMIHLWTEDIGEWETLPPLLERRIRINGQNLSLTRQNHAHWVKSRYLMGRNDKGETPWDSFGQRRGGLIQAPITIANGQFTLEFAGSNAQATTVTGLLLEPLGDQLFSKVQFSRKNWFDQRWPFIIEPKTAERKQDYVIAFPGETLFVSPKKAALKPHPNIITKDWARKTAFHRTYANTGLLIKTSRRLTPDKHKTSGRLLQLIIPPSIAPGLYDLGIIRVEVVKQAKPKLNKSIGVYLEPPPHLKTPNDLNMQTWCDLDYLKRLGLTAIAPPFSENVVADYQRAKSFGFRDVLAYTPMKRTHQAVKDAIKTGKVDDLIFSIADEPSNPAQAQNIKLLSAFLQNESPNAKRAGHLNNPKDKKHLEHLDVVLANSGFGVDKSDISGLKKRGKTPWFYNMENIRLAAGFYLWRTKADGYLQWHARMPTADPYDPTDGREDDVQMLYPSEIVCSQGFEIDLTLVQMVNGLSDLRWLIWLEEQAKRHNDAHILLRQIKKRIPVTWGEAQALSPAHWSSLRQKIQKLALTLQH